MFGRDEEYEIKTMPSNKSAIVRQRSKRLRLCLFWAAWIAFLLEVISLSALVIYVGIQSFLPAGFFAVLLVSVAVICGIQMLSLRLQKRPAASSVFSLILSSILIFMSVAGLSLLNFVYARYGKTNEGAHTTTIVLSVYVRSDSSYKELEDLKGYTLGIRDDKVTDTMEQAVKKVHEALEDQIQVIAYSDYEELVKALRNEDVDAIILDQAIVDNITETLDPTFAEWTRVLPTSVKVEQEIEQNKVSISTDPFIVYISGLDTRGNRPIADNGLSDVNQIAIVNPVAKQILLINTPRDTYVALNGDTSKMDKLTHAGLYGVTCSMDTLSALYDIEFNYYIKVNFNSVINIVDALGGVVVNSKYSFYCGGTSGKPQYYITQGANYMNGSKALAFARHRYNLPGGDMQRGANQQAVIRAVLEKITSSAIIANFTEVLTAVTENTKTNISTEEINELIQMQLSDMASWDIQTYAMFGGGIKGPLYSFGGSEEYQVLSAPADQVAEIKALINEVMNAHK